MSGKTSDLYVVGMLGSPETWMVPEAAVSNPARSSRRCSSPSTVDSAARRACYDRAGPALPGGRAAAVRVRGPNLGEYADSLVAKAQVRATLATISDDAYNEYLDLRSLEETREEVAGTPSPESQQDRGCSPWTRSRRGADSRRTRWLSTARLLCGLSRQGGSSSQPG